MRDKTPFVVIQSYAIRLPCYTERAMWKVFYIESWLSFYNTRHDHGNYLIWVLDLVKITRDYLDRHTDVRCVRWVLWRLSILRSASPQSTREHFCRLGWSTTENGSNHFEYHIEPEAHPFCNSHIFYISKRSETLFSTLDYNCTAVLCVNNCSIWQPALDYINTCLFSIM